MYVALTAFTCYFLVSRGSGSRSVWFQSKNWQREKMFCGASQCPQSWAHWFAPHTSFQGHGHCPRLAQWVWALCGTSGSPHNGRLSQGELWQSSQGVGSACFESRTLVLGCTSLREAETDWFRGWRTVLSSCHGCGPLHGSVFAPHIQILLHVLYVVFIIWLMPFTKLIWLILILPWTSKWCWSYFKGLCWGLEVNVSVGYLLSVSSCCSLCVIGIRAFCTLTFCYRSLAACHTK